MADEERYDAVDVETFLVAYLENWRGDGDRVDAIFHPGGTLRVPGQSEPLEPDAVAAMVAATKQLLPDVAIEILRWAERDGELFIEWEMTATYEGRRLRWGGINRNTLRGQRSIDAVSHWDRMSLSRQLDPSDCVEDPLQGVVSRQTELS